MTKLITQCCFILFLGSLLACSAELVKSAQSLDLSHVERIDLQLENNNPSASVDNVASLVSKNLADWGYPVGAKAGQSFSHVLTATIDPIAHGNTPTGFSFSAGNSDPRAMDFQKTDVLPITCGLKSIKYPEQSNGLNMGFTANAAKPHSLSADTLADHISTVCFNLLRELKWPEALKKPAEAASKPSWVPEVTIENKASTSLDTPTPSTEPRQQIIIHNQGSPVILHWGHERR